MTDCPFCSPVLALVDGTTLENGLAYVREDNYAVSPGHLLLIPKRHTADWFELTQAEQGAVIALVNQAKAWLEQEYKPAGYNIGMNCGQAAGQTVMHMHCHLIPRYEGDSEDPRGGVRWVIPEKAAYWSKE